MVSKFHLPIECPYTITQTYAEHLEYAAAHPGIVYNGGIDLYSDDKQISAAFDGVVVKVAYQASGYGNYVKLSHDWGFSIYAHLDRSQVNFGDQVSAGDHIGIMGSSGFSTGTHLHFELRDLDDRPIDPSKYFFEEGPINTVTDLVTLVAPAGGNLRRVPMGDLITTIPAGTVGHVLAGPVEKYGYTCYKVEFPVSGWIAERDFYGTEIIRPLNKKE